MSRALLDINVLIALLDEDHVHHDRARRWMETRSAAGWASCPITQNGCVRVMSQQAYPGALAPSAVMERLTTAARHASHEFWPDDVSVLDDALVDRSRVHGPRQVTDAYLLALAVSRDGCLATFDQGVPTTAVRRAARRHVVVV